MCERNPDGTFAMGHTGLKDSQNGHWKGDAVGYAGVHFWIIRQCGKADHCEVCGLNDKSKEVENILIKRRKLLWLRKKKRI
jgi:hypothetical protein